MGAIPSSAVQQTTYLEALDEYIDYDEHGNLRTCLLDSKGNRLLDSEAVKGTLKPFAIDLLFIVTISRQGRKRLESCTSCMKHLSVAVGRLGYRSRLGKLSSESRA